jgi:hypothetical protein
MQVLQGMKNASDCYGTYMRVLQWMQNACDYFQNLYTGTAYLKISLWNL